MLQSVNMRLAEPLLLTKQRIRLAASTTPAEIEASAPQQLRLVRLFKMPAIERLFAHAGSAAGLAWKRIIMKRVPSVAIRI